MKNCAFCGKEFQPNRRPGGKHKVLYCSRQCSAKARSQKVEVACSVCGRLFLRKRYHASRSGERGQFCGFECYSKWQSENLRAEKNPAWRDRLTLQCSWCGQSFDVRPYEAHRLFCSRECFLAAWRSDYPHPTTLYNALWDRQRQAALDRDGHACQSCGSHDRLVVHHQKPLREFLAEAVIRAHALDNLETLCEGCHGHQHSQLAQSRKPNP